MIDMNDNQAKTISTVAIWAATTLIFIFVVRHFSWSDILSGLFLTLIAIALAIAPAAATHAIWNRPSSENSRKNESNEPPKS